MRFTFSGHVAVLEELLARREAIVDAFERQLFSARGKAHAQNGDRESIGEVFNVSELRGHLEAAHLEDGFQPARQDGYSRGLDPVELVLRACHHWDATRWPGRNARLLFAERLYATFVLQQLEQLSLRIWDDGHEHALEHLQHVQRLLDELNAGQFSHGIMVRDARWLIQTAQGPLTRNVRPYFIKAEQVSRSFDDTYRLEIHKAGAVLAGGHLRSQLRRLSWQTGWAFDDPKLIALTRSSNSMDMALLVRDLVPLLDAYAAACVQGNEDMRVALADPILQGLSADPELLLTRLDLLGPSTTIEDVSGEVDREYLARYGKLVAATITSLQHDRRAFDLSDAVYSPLGIVYGFCADLVSNMVLATVRQAAAPDLTLEDLFNSRARLDEKQTLTHEWERLPKREGEPNAFEHSVQWASQMYVRLINALDARAVRPIDPNASTCRMSCLYVVPRGVAVGSRPDGLPAEAQSAKAGVLPPGIVSAQEHCLTSDVTRARISGATILPADRLMADRAEGRLLACAQAGGAWFGVSKVPLTLFISQGKDALITDVPREVVDILRVSCPELLVVIDARLANRSELGP